MMINKPLILMLIVCLMASTGCAARNRWFSQFPRTISRGDYSEMQDPFMQSDELASADSPRKNAADDGEDVAGRATLDLKTSPASSTRDSSLQAGVSGPKPIPGRKSLSVAEGAPRTEAEARAAYPDDSRTLPNSTAAAPSRIRSYDGPEIEDFLNRRKEAVAEATADAPAQSAEMTQNPSSTASVSADPMRSARPASVGTLSREAESFSDYLTQKSGVAQASAQRVVESRHENEETTADFDDWTKQQQAAWSQRASDKASAATAGPGAALQAARDAAGAGKTAAEDFPSGIAESTPENDLDAKPLLRRYEGKQSASRKSSEILAPNFDETAGRTANGSGDAANPFETDIFFDQDPSSNTASPKSPVPQTPSSQATRGRSLDESFEFSRGWRPTHITPPESQQ